MANFPTGINK